MERGSRALRRRWGVTVVGRVPGRAVERIAVLRVRCRSVRKGPSLAPSPSSSIQIIQFNLGGDGIARLKELIVCF